jgi:hypothetical protein
MVDAFLAHFWRFRPVDATFMGEHAHNDRLPPVGAAALAQERAGLAALAEALAGSDEPAETSARLDRRMIAAEVAFQAAQAERRPRFDNPAWASGEAAFAIVSLLLPQSAPVRHEALLARLQALPDFLADASGWLAQRPAPAGWVTRARREAAAMALFLDEDIRLHGEHREDWSAPADAAASAFRRFAEAIADRPDADPACGEAFLSLVTGAVHGLATPPRALLAEAEAAFARLGEEMAAMAARVDCAATPATILAGLSERRAASVDAVRELYVAWDRRAREAGRDLVTPADEYGLDYRLLAPCFRRLAPVLYFLFYRSPPGLDAGAGSVYWVMPPGPDAAAYLAANSEATVKTIHAVHHGSIGHHTQNTRARAAASRLARVAGTDGALGLAFLGAGTLIEGWACYVEDLLMEAPGFYSPEETLLLKQYERRNVASVMVDIKLHCGDWSLAEAAAFYRDEAGFNPARVEGEVNRNSMFPGSRLMYAIGVDGIKALRRRWTGSTRVFHDTLLSHGHVPLAWVTDEMDRTGQLGP